MYGRELTAAEHKKFMKAVYKLNDQLQNMPVWRHCLSWEGFGLELTGNSGGLWKSKFPVWTEDFTTILLAKYVHTGQFCLSLTD